MSRDSTSLALDSARRVQQSSQTLGASQRDTINGMSSEFIWTQTVKTEALQATQAAQSVGQFAQQALKIS